MYYYAKYILKETLATLLVIHIVFIMIFS